MYIRREYKECYLVILILVLLSVVVSLIFSNGRYSGGVGQTKLIKIQRETKQLCLDVPNEFLLIPPY